MTSTSLLQLISPVRTMFVSMRGSEVSRPMVPKNAISHSQSFSCWAWGAWSVTRQSIEPSTMPLRRASMSLFRRSGGFIFRLVL